MCEECAAYDAVKSPDPVRESQVGAAVNRYGYVISDVEALTDDLFKRLEGVTLHFPTPGAPESAQDRPLLAPYAERIERENDRLAAVRERLSYLLSALEV